MLFKGALWFWRRKNATGVEGADDVGRERDGGGVHRFASARESAVSDCRRIRMLEEALAAQHLRVGEHGEGDSVRLASDRLIAAARETGDYIAPDLAASFGELKRKQSGESAVYFDAKAGVFTKVKNPAAKSVLKHTTPSDWLYEHIVHNILFPESRYEFKGITEELHEARIVLVQKAVSTERRASDAQVEEILRGMGLMPEDRFFFGNEVLAVTDVGVRGDNVLVDDNGGVCFIDPLIRLKKPAKEVIKALVGDCDA